MIGLRAESLVCRQQAAGAVTRLRELPNCQNKNSCKRGTAAESWLRMANGGNDPGCLIGTRVKLKTAVVRSITFSETLHMEERMYT